MANSLLREQDRREAENYGTGDMSFTGPQYRPKPTPPPSGAFNVIDRRKWGGIGGVYDPATNRYTHGTPVADADIARYRAMGAQKQAAVALDQADADRARGIQMGSLARLQDAAAGGAPSAAAIKGQMATSNAVRSGTMSAGGARSPGAAVAAMRGGIAGSGAQMAHGSGTAIDARVGEMGEARGQYMGGTLGLRGQDIQAATTNAQLEAQQRAQDAQRQLFYERLGYETKNQVLGGELGRTAAEQAAANANRSQNLAERQADFETLKAIGSMSLGAAQGGLNAYAQAQAAPQQQPAPSPERQQFLRDVEQSDARVKYIPSDKRKKTEGRPVTKAELDKLDAAEFMSRETREPTSFTRDRQMQSFSRDPEPLPMVPAEPDASDYAKKAAHYLSGGLYEPEQRMRPMNLNDYKKRMGPPGKPDKREAFAPKYEPSGGAPAAQSVRDSGVVDVDASSDKGIVSKARGKGRDSLTPAQYKQLFDALPIDERIKEQKRTMDYDVRQAAREKETREMWAKSRAEVAAAAAEDQRIRAMIAEQNRVGIMRSDERAKSDKSSASMAAANRAMVPSAYAYKPQYLPPEQKPGEVNVGPMAQNMARDPVAGTAIVKGPDGMLAIDKDKGLKLVMGGLSSLQREVDAIKKGRK